MLFCYSINILIIRIPNPCQNHKTFTLRLHHLRNKEFLCTELSDHAESKHLVPFPIINLIFSLSNYIIE